MEVPTNLSPNIRQLLGVYACNPPSKLLNELSTRPSHMIDGGLVWASVQAGEEFIQSSKLGVVRACRLLSSGLSKLLVGPKPGKPEHAMLQKSRPFLNNSC